MARLPDDRKEQIRDATPIDELVTSYGIRLRQRGRLLWGLCPFHQDAHPSLSVDTAKGRFRCWSCNTGGDVFHFVELFEGVEFYEALVMLAERAGISLAGGRRQKPGEADRRKNQKSYLLKLNGSA